MKRAAAAARTTQIAAGVGLTVVGWAVRAFEACALSWGLVADPVAAMQVSPNHERHEAAEVELAMLVYELLDAHADTAQLAATLEGDPRWAAHLDYLRVLQRKGREVLAHSGNDRPVSLLERVNRAASGTGGPTGGGT